MKIGSIRPYAISLLFTLSMIVPLVKVLANPNEITIYRPAVTVGLGSGITIPFADDALLFSYGTEGTIDLRYHLKETPFVFVDTSVSYLLLPVVGGGSLSVPAAGFGIGLDFRIANWLQIQPFIKGGYFIAFLNGVKMDPGGNFWFGGGLSIVLSIFDSFGFFLNGAFDQKIGLQPSLRINGGIKIDRGNRSSVRTIKSPQIPQPTPAEMQTESGSGVEYNEPQLADFQYFNVFPVFYKYYQDNPVATARIENPNDTSIERLRIKFFINHYMDTPKSCASPERIEAGESGDVELFALFNKNVLEITEKTTVSATISLEYRVGGSSHTNSQSVDIQLFSRNQMTWTDDKRLAAFITTGDPTVLNFARNVTGAVSSMIDEVQIDENLAKAAALHEALRLFGTEYEVDPTTPYKSLSGAAESVDNLQFPVQTLEYGNGDCDDLTILYCALLESVGVETGFITIPGHILPAFQVTDDFGRSTNQATGTAKALFLDGSYWIPVEATLRKESFLSAWETAGAEWQRYAQAGDAEFFSTHEAWEAYDAVGFSSTGLSLALPDDSSIQAEFKRSTDEVIARLITPRVNALKERIRTTDNAPKYVNNLGVLYARHGLLDLAKERFTTAWETNNYAPAGLNLGNLEYLEGNYDTARTVYERYLDAMPENVSALANLCRVCELLGDIDAAKSYYNKLNKVDAEAAERFAKLADTRGGTGRASDIEASVDDVLWEEER